MTHLQVGHSGETHSWPEHRDRDDDRPRLECGVFGVFNTPEASAITALGLHALQHRGQEACGIACFDGQRFHTERHMGYVGDAFAGPDLVQRLPGSCAIGHTRYSTAGGSLIRNVQPMFADLEAGGVAIAHNGNLTNFLTIRERLVSEGAIFQSTSDSEVILHLIARSRKAKVVDRFIDALMQIEGGYALVALTNKKMIGVRDPLGIRPLVLGDLNGKPVVTTSGTTSVQLLRAHEKAKGIDFREIYGKDHAESFLLLENDRAAAFVMDDILIAGLVANSRNARDYRFLDEVLRTEPYGIMIRKDDPAFKKLVDDTLASLMKSGDVARLYARWFTSPIPPRGINLDFPISRELAEAIKSPNDRGI